MILTEGSQQVAALKGEINRAAGVQSPARNLEAEVGAPAEVEVDLAIEDEEPAVQAQQTLVLEYTWRT